METLRIAAGVVLLIISFSLPYFEKIVDNTPSIRQSMAMIEPSKENIDMVKNHDYVTNTVDREKLALVAYEFSSRIPKYETNVQKVQDIHHDAVKDLFGTEYQGKYKEISDLLGSKAISSVTGVYDSYLTDEQKKALSERFYATAWVLGE